MPSGSADSDLLAEMTSAPPTNFGFYPDQSRPASQSRHMPIGSESPEKSELIEEFPGMGYTSSQSNFASRQEMVPGHLRIKKRAEDEGDLEEITLSKYQRASTAPHHMRRRSNRSKQEIVEAQDNQFSDFQEGKPQDANKIIKVEPVPEDQDFIFMEGGTTVGHHQFTLFDPPIHSERSSDEDSSSVGPSEQHSLSLPSARDPRQEA